MSKKNSDKKGKIKMTEQINNSNNIELDPNVIEFEKEAKIQQEQKEQELENKIDEPLIKNQKVSKKNNKKQHKKSKALVACFVLLLAVGVGGNWYFENSSLGEKIKPILSSEEVKTLGQAEFVDANANQSNQNEYFTKARVERQSTRDEALEKLQALVDNADNNKEQSVNATNEIAKISKHIAIENKVETLVTAKGVKNCLAIVNTDGNKIDIIVDVDELNEQIIMQIKDVAIEQLGCTFEDVTIIQANK